MARFESYAAGQFSWVDLMSKDPEASKAFYAALFGWKGADNRDDQGGGYTMFQMSGLDIAGMGVMSEEMKASGMPPVWSSYVTVEDCDASAAHARALGGELQMPVIDIEVGGGLVGRMTVLADPEGARISLWQPGRHAGAAIANEPGTFAWNELMTRDVDGARRFYGQLFGWDVAPIDGAENGYQEIRVGGRSNGGMLPWHAEMGEMPAAWSVYFAVRDCDEAVRKIQELGGDQLVPPTEVGAGRFAVVADPQGAVFNVMAMNTAA